MSGRPLVLLLGALALVACAPATQEPAADPPASNAAAAPTPPASAPAASPSPSASSTAAASPTPSPTPSPTSASDGRARDAVLSIEALDVDELTVESYGGSPDDGPGTEIQDTGIAASPHGSDGGTGVGGIGNYIVTAHRLSSTRAFLNLPDLDEGAEVVLTADGQRYRYQITETRETSFRSSESLAEQSAAVPGEPGTEADQAMITLSTCATPEDDADGNFWRDEVGNPEHRIDKIGVLVAIEDLE